MSKNSIPDQPEDRRKTSEYRGRHEFA